MMKLQKSGMHHTIQTKWNVRNATVLSPCGRVQRAIFHPCTLSIANTEHSNTSRELPPARLLYITVGFGLDDMAERLYAEHGMG